MVENKKLLPNDKYSRNAIFFIWCVIVTKITP